MLRWVGAIAIAPLWLPLHFVAYSTEVAFLPAEWALRRRMRRQGRAVRMAELRADLVGGKGSLIVEWPTPGWRFSRLWWTDEAVPNGSPTRGSVLPFARRYTDPDAGRARLVAVWNGDQ